MPSFVAVWYFLCQVWSCVPVYQSDRLFVCLTIWLSVCPSVCLSVELCLGVGLSTEPHSFSCSKVILNCRKNHIPVNLNRYWHVLHWSYLPQSCLASCIRVSSLTCTLIMGMLGLRHICIMPAQAGKGNTRMRLHASSHDVYTHGSVFLVFPKPPLATQL